MTSRKFMYMNKNVFTRTFVKSALLQNVCTLVIRCVPPAHFTHKYRGQIMGAVSTTDKTFEPFSEWDFSLKKTFPRRVSAHRLLTKETPVEILPIYAIAHSPMVHYI